MNCSDAEFERSWPQVKHLFYLANDRYRHKKVDEVLGKLDTYHEQKRQAGIASGERRRNGRSTGVGSPLKKKPTENEPTATATTTATTASTGDRTAQPPEPGIATLEFPETAAAVRRYFPAADNAIVGSIAQLSCQAYADVVNGSGRAAPLTDAVIAAAVAEAHFPKQTSAGLFREKVPRVIRTWAEEAVRKNSTH